MIAFIIVQFSCKGRIFGSFNGIEIAIDALQSASTLGKNLSSVPIKNVIHRYYDGEDHLV